MTDQELQTLRNMGNEAEAAADEIERLTAEQTLIRVGGEHNERALMTNIERLTAERDALRQRAEMAEAVAAGDGVLHSAIAAVEDERAALRAALLALLEDEDYPEAERMARAALARSKT